MDGLYAFTLGYLEVGICSSNLEDLVVSTGLLGHHLSCFSQKMVGITSGWSSSPVLPLVLPHFLHSVRATCKATLSRVHRLKTEQALQECQLAGL